MFELLEFEITATTNSYLKKGKKLKTYSKKIIEKNNITYNMSFSEVDVSSEDVYLIKVKAEGIFNICKEEMTFTIKDETHLRKIIDLIYYK